METHALAVQIFKMISNNVCVESGTDTHCVAFDQNNSETD